MARDYENSDEISALSDSDLHRLVRDTFDREMAIDPDDLVVSVRDGRVTVAGRVGTEGELRIADHILSDTIGLSDYANDLVVDPIRRAESPEAIDDHLADEAEHEGLLLGDRAVPFSPEAEHLEENLSAELLGTTDPRAATEGGVPWVPPESPTPEGMGGPGSADRAARGEDH
jgi:hypothetical protein